MMDDRNPESPGGVTRHFHLIFQPDFSEFRHFNGRRDFQWIRSSGKDADMRVSIRLSFRLAVLSLCAGCATLQSPFSGSASREDASRKRLVAEMNARAERGDIEGARQILEQLDHSQPGETVTFNAAQPGLSRTEKAEIIEELLASEPAAERERKRALYDMYSPARLRAMQASRLQTQQIGQQQLNQQQIATIDQPSLHQPRTQPGASGAFGAPGAAGSEMAGTAPDPRQTQVAAGINDPWTNSAAQLLPSGQVAPAGQAPLLPGNPFEPSIGLTSGQPAAQTPVQQLSGTVGTGGAVPALGQSLPQYPSSSNPFPAAPQLPVINPAGTGLQPNFSSSGSLQGPASPANGSGVELLTPSFTGEAGIGTTQAQATAPATAPAGGLDPYRPAAPSAFLIPGLPAGSGASSTSAAAAGQVTDERSPQKSLPGVLGDRMQSLLPGIRNAAERTLPEIPSIRNLAQNSAIPASATATVPATDFSVLIASLERELAAVAPGQTEGERLEYARRHVNLRMLYLMAGRVDQAVEPITGLEAADQEFWQQLAWSIGNYFDARGIPQSGTRAARTVEQLRAAMTQLAQKADLQLRNVTFCHRIVSFGNFERFAQDRFTTGAPVVLYAEVENFTSHRVDAERFRTALQPTITLYRAGDESRPVEVIPFEVTEDFCRSIRRDYYLSHMFSIPQNLERGNYTLVLKVVDLQGNKVATSRVNFEVVLVGDNSRR